jgi:ketosteroid isomerase-like protein
MQSWLGKKLVNHQLEALRAGDPEPSLRLDARKVEMLFPGDSSWGGLVKGKKAHKAWLERLCATGLQLFADEVIVKGLPCNTTICIRGTDHLDDDSGNRVYENRYVIWGKLRWGKLRRYEVYEDTVKTLALDRWMDETGHPASASVLGAARCRRRERRQAA